MSMLLSFGLFSSCSSSDEDDPSNVLVIENSTNNAKKEASSNEKKTDDTTSEEQPVEETLEGVSFNIFHEDSEGPLVFRTEEPIVFQLTYATYGNPIISQDLKEGDLIADQNLFAIYREDGEKVGQPQLDRIDLTAFETAVGPYVFRYIWSAQKGDAKLEPGNYYTQFSIMFNTIVGGSNGLMERKDFKVNFEIK